MTERGAHSGADGPVLGTPGQFPERPRHAVRSLVLLVIGAVIAVAMGGWGYVMMSAGGNPDVLTQVIAFEIGGPGSVTVTFQAHKPAERVAVCKLRATDIAHVEVGAREVTIPKGRSDVRLTERVETSARAASGHVQYCYLVQ